MRAKNNKPRALVIGGSLGGLCAGVCLRAAGWRVSIFERSPGLMDDRGAGIVLQSEVLNLLEGLKLATCADISVESRERQYLNKDGSVASSGDSQQLKRMQHGAKFLKRLPKRRHQINQGRFRFSLPKNSGGLDRWEWRLQGDEHCPWMEQLADLLRSESHAAARGHLGEQCAQPLDPVMQARRKAHPLESAAYHIVPSWKLVLVKTDKNLVLQLCQSDSLSEGQQMVIRQHGLEGDSYQDIKVKFAGEFRARIARKSEINAPATQSLHL